MIEPHFRQMEKGNAPAAAALMEYNAMSIAAGGQGVFANKPNESFFEGLLRMNLPRVHKFFYE
jgi:hypothetical protein